VLLTTLFYVGAGISVVGIITYIVAYSPVRNARYMILMATLLAGLFVYWLLHGEILERERVRKVALVVVVAVLLVSIPISVMNSFMPGYHMTYSEKEGMQWFYNARNEERLAVSHDVSKKTRMYLQGGVYADPGVVSIGGEESPVPEYFGYPDHDSVAAALNGTPAYLVTKGYDEEYYLYLKKFVRNEEKVYNSETIEKLGDDETAAKVYSNGGFKIWYVSGRSGRGANRTASASSTAGIPPGNHQLPEKHT